jgi:hypothetical protein
MTEINPSSIPNSELIDAPWKSITKNKEFRNDSLKCKIDEPRCINPCVNILLAFTDVLNARKVRFPEKPEG